jgi:hypothetical protein
MNQRPALVAFVAIGSLTVGGLVGRTTADLPSHSGPMTTAASVAVTSPAPAAEVRVVPEPIGRREPAHPAVRVAGLQLQRPLTRPSEFGGTSAFFGSDDRVRLALEFDLTQVAGAAGKQVVEFQSDASRLTRFVDDRGTALVGDRSFGGPFDMQSRISEDGRGLLVTVLGNGVPERGARTIEAEGMLAVLCAGTRAIETSEAVKLTLGSKFTVGGIPFEVGETGAAQFDASRWSLELATDADLGAVLSWALVTAEGEVVALDESMTWVMNGRTSKTLVAPRAFEQAALRIERWTDAATVEVPFRVTTGVTLE